MTTAIYRPLDHLGDYDEVEVELLEDAKNSPALYLEKVAARAEADFYFFLRYVHSRCAHRDYRQHYICHPWQWEAAVAVQLDYDGVLDVWGRYHGKSTIKTEGFLLWQYLRQPRESFAIFSIIRSLAQAHLKGLRQELETNPFLHKLWPDRFYPTDVKPKQHGAASWSLDDGLCMPLWPGGNTATFEAWGMSEDAFPTSKHYGGMVLDDITDERTVTTPEQITKAQERYKLLGGLSKKTGTWRTAHGTYYKDDDLLVWILRNKLLRYRFRDSVEPCDHPQHRDIGGCPVFLTEKAQRDALRDLGNRYGQQMRGDPLSGLQAKLGVDRLRFYHTSPAEEARGKTVYILADRGGKESADSDPSAILVVGLGTDRNIYVLDALKIICSPYERILLYMELHRRWKPIQVRIEEHADRADSSHLAALQERQHYRFDVLPLSVKTWSGGKPLQKENRIHDILDPVLAQHQLYLPTTLWRQAGERRVDMVNDAELGLLHEFQRFPATRQDHFLDAACMLWHPDAPDLVWPREQFPDDPLYDGTLELYLSQNWQIQHLRQEHPWLVM